LIHDLVRHVAAGIATEESEHPWAVEFGRQVGLARDEVEVKVVKALRFGEQCDVGLAAVGNLAQR
jgi:hypothetical protein